MTRPIAIVGASSSIIRPYDDGEMRQLSRAPDAARAGADPAAGCDRPGDVHSALSRLCAAPRRARNEEEVLRGLLRSAAAATAHERFAPVLGVTVASCWLSGRATDSGGPVGLVYVDAHADFATGRIQNRSARA